MRARLFFSVAAVAAMLCPAWVCYAEEMTASQILGKIDDVAYSKSSKGVMSQVVTTPGGDVRTYRFEGLTLDGTDKALSIYMEPSKVKGVKILVLNDGDDIWTFFPRTGRVRKIASSARKQRVMGSDFSYDDFAGGKFERNYTAERLPDVKEKGVDCYVLQMTPTPEGPKYAKLVGWVDRESFVPVKIDYYDEDGMLLKRLTVMDVQDIQGHLTPMKLVMENLQEGGQTAVETESIVYDIPLSASDFSERSLQK